MKSVSYYRIDYINSTQSLSTIKHRITTITRLTAPVSISNMRAPRLHQSTALPCPLRISISGALKQCKKPFSSGISGDNISIQSLYWQMKRVVTFDSGFGCQPCPCHDAVTASLCLGSFRGFVDKTLSKIQPAWINSLRTGIANCTLHQYMHGDLYDLRCYGNILTFHLLTC